MENKKNYKQWNKNTKVQKRNEELQETITGFLIFTDRNKEKGAVKDALNILNDATEELYPTLLEDSKKEETKQETTLNNIEKELSQLKMLSKIVLRRNYITDKGISSICENIKELPLLHILDIRQNIFSVLGNSIINVTLKILNNKIMIKYN